VGPRLFGGREGGRHSLLRPHVVGEFHAAWAEGGRIQPERLGHGVLAPQAEDHATHLEEGHIIVGEARRPAQAVPVECGGCGKVLHREGDEADARLKGRNHAVGGVRG